MRTISISCLTIAALLVGCKGGPVPNPDQSSPPTGEALASQEPASLPESQRATRLPKSKNGEVPNQPADESVWEPGAGEFVLRDENTGSLWNLRGEAFSGPMKGKRLQQLNGFNAFWFAWSVFHHGSDVWKHGENLPGKINLDDDCSVPCDQIVMGCPGKDCIPALDHDGKAKMVRPDAPGADYLEPDDMVLGVWLDGRARAYPHNILWWHEILNDEIAGHAFSVTFCPLTGSGLVFDGAHDGEPVDFGVSGRLYNSNLVMYDRQSDTFWSQMLRSGIKGKKRGEELDLLPVVETTWAQWKKMHPRTLVVSVDTGYRRNYEQYPYGDYRTNHDNTFRPTRPEFEDTYDAKDRVLNVVGDKTQRAYAFEALREKGDRVVVNDTLDGEPILLVYDAETRTAVPFSATVDGVELEFEVAKAP